MAEKKKSFIEEMAEGFSVEREGNEISEYKPQEDEDEQGEQEQGEQEQGDQTEETEEVEDNLGDNEDDEEEGDTEQEYEEDPDESSDNGDNGEESESDDQGESEEEEEGEDERGQGDSQEDQEESRLNAFEYTEGVFETEGELKDHVQILKENPEILDMIKFFKEQGTLLPYLQATQIDVDKFSDIDVLRAIHNDKYQGQGLEQEDIDFLFEEKVLSRFQIDEDLYDEDTLAKKKRALAIEIKAEANKGRERLKEEQAKLRLPTRDGSAEKNAEEAKKASEAMKNKLAYSIRKEIKDNKLVVKVSEDQSVTLTVSPKKITQLLNDTKDPSIFLDSKGDFDLRKMAAHIDINSFMSNVIGNSKASGKADFVRENLKNRKKRTDRSPEREGKPRFEKLDPRDPNSWKGAKIIR